MSADIKQTQKGGWENSSVSGCSLFVVAKVFASTARVEEKKEMQKGRESTISIDIPTAS